jgi:arylsulfatase A-like enzyme
LLVLALLGGFGPACGGAPSAPDPPDILLISLDSVRADRLTFRDPGAAPHMSALAGEGTIFTQAISGSSWTLPAHAQIFTGSPPVLHGVRNDDIRIDPKMPTLPELLRGRGYFTAGFFTAGYLWGDYGFDRGFDVYRSAVVESDRELESGARAPRGKRSIERSREFLDEDHITSDRVLRLSEELFESLPADRPVFLFLHLFDPHYDYIPPPPWDTRFDRGYIGDIDGRGLLHNKRIYDRSKQPARQISDRDLRHLIGLYRGEIGWTDQAIGEILALFDRAGRLDDALVVITSDHGEEFFEHGHFGHRLHLHDEVLKVPLAIVPPARLRGGLRGEYEGQVSLSDILPTILDFAGMDPPGSVYGRSLRPLMFGEASDDRPLLSSLYAVSWVDEGRHRHALVHSLRTQDFKFIRQVRVDRRGEPVLRHVALYDLRTDPGERRPLTDPDHPQVIEAWRRFEAEMERVRRLRESLPRSPTEKRKTDVAWAVRHQLRVLCYLEGEVEAGREFPVLDLPWGVEPMPALAPPAPPSR